MTLEQARVLVENPLYLGCLMIKAGDADDLERLTQAAEDLADSEAADAARAEIAEHGTIP